MDRVVADRLWEDIVVAAVVCSMDEEGICKNTGVELYVGIELVV